MTLSNVFNIFYLVLKCNIYTNLKRVQFPINGGRNYFCDCHEQRDSFSTSIPKSCKNGLLKNYHLRLTNIFSL